MKKFLFKIVIYIILIIFVFLAYLSIIGIETTKFNNLITKQINSKIPNVELNSLEKIKFKLDYKNLRLFFSTKNPELSYDSTDIPIKNLKVYLDVVSLIQSKLVIKKVNASIDTIKIIDLQKLAVSYRPSNIKRFILNNIVEGSIRTKIELDIDRNQKISNYKVSGNTRDLNIIFDKINVKDSSFSFKADKNLILINNVSANLKGIPFIEGVININREENLIIDGSFKTELNVNQKKLKELLKDFFNLAFLENDIKISANFLSNFNIIFSKTLAIKDYNYSLKGKIKKAEIKFKKEFYNSLLKKKVSKIELEKSNILVKINKDNKNSFLIDGLYKINNKKFVKYNVKNNLNKLISNYTINLDLNEHINFKLLNYEKPIDRTANIIANIILKKNIINIKDFLYKEAKNEIVLKNIKINNHNLESFNNIKVKTFNKNSENNNFNIQLDKKIYISGSSFDATNLLKKISSKKNNNFLNKINKAIEIRIDKINSNKTESLNDFYLLGKIKKGKFVKILSKSEFSSGNYLDISLLENNSTGYKDLEIFSDIPKFLLSDYNFFKGIENGKLTFNTSFNNKESQSNLVIEDFRVKNAPAFAKLLALADFGGISDLLSGDGISFDRLEIDLSDNNNVLNINEIFAVGPSISILMEGYQESSSGLISLKGTMVPAKELNKLISKIPVIGNILIPKEAGEGLFGVSFKIKGLPGKTKITVNPIKTLTPRFITKALEKRKKAK